MKSIQELTAIGSKINIAFLEIAQAIERTILTEEELKDFSKYLSEQDALMPLMHPTEYKNGGAEALMLVSKRVVLLQKILPLLPKPGVKGTFDLKNIPTLDLVNELAKRVGVKEINAPSGGKYEVCHQTSDCSGSVDLFVDGPARILVVTE